MSKNTKRATLSPRDAKRFHQICQLRTDHKDTKHGWLMVDEGKVTIMNQQDGQSSTGEVTFSRREFNALVDWYLHPQVKTKP